MKIKRVLAVAMAMSISLSLLSGCGNSAGGSGSGKASIDSKSLPKKLDSNKIRIMAYDGWEEEHADIRKNLKEWYGADVEYVVVDWKEQKNKLAVDLAANITYDLVPVGKDLILNNLVTPITDYVDKDDKIFKGLGNVFDYLTYKGDIYGMPSVPNMQVIIYNKTLIENLGLDLPLDLYNAGNWNFNSLKELTSSLAKEKTAGGDKIQPFSSWDTTIFAKANDTGYIKWDGDDFSLNLDDPKLRESLNFYKDLVSTDSFVGWQGWSQADFQLGSMAMCMDRFGNKTHFVADLNFDWDFVPIPTGPSSKGNSAPGTVAKYGVPKGSKNPSGGAAYAYLFCKQDFESREKYLKGYLNDEQVKRFESLYSKINLDYEEIGINNADELIWEINANSDVTSVLESYKTKWQGEIDAYKNGLPTK